MPKDFSAHTKAVRDKKEEIAQVVYNAVQDLFSELGVAKYDVQANERLHDAIEDFLR